MCAACVYVIVRVRACESVCDVDMRMPWILTYTVILQTMNKQDSIESFDLTGLSTGAAKERGRVSPATQA